MNAAKHGLSSPRLFFDGRLAEIAGEYMERFRDEFPLGDGGDELCREWVETVLMLREVERLKEVSIEVHEPLVLGYAAIVSPFSPNAHSVPARSAERFVKELSRLSRYEEQAYARLKRIAPLVRLRSASTDAEDTGLS